MKKLIFRVALVIALSIFLIKISDGTGNSSRYIPEVVKVNPQKTKVVSTKTPPKESPVEVSKLKSPEVVNLSKSIPTMVLGSKDTVVFQGVVTAETVSSVMEKLAKKSSRLPKGAPLYLVLDTPGGSVFDGLDLIDFVDALPRKVHTITLFAASMGFQFAQNMGDRLIQRNGTLMSHRASTGGLAGQFDGELESRYMMVKRKIDFLDNVAAKRMKLPLKKYKALVVNEYWVHGFDSVKDNAADKMVLLRCGKSLRGTNPVKYNTRYGRVTVYFSRCPLIKAPLKIIFDQKMNIKQQGLALNLIKLSIHNKPKFVRTIIKSLKYRELFNTKY